MTHLFDEAIALAPLGGDLFTGATHPAWANMVGPFGGISAATALNAVLQHPQLLGEPVALTVNFCAGLTEAPFTVQARPVRTNRSTQHWVIELTQPDADGQVQTALTATAMTALRRDSWDANDMPMPQVTPAVQVPIFRREGVTWLKRYEMRPIAGLIPHRWEGQAATDDPVTASLSQLWMRDNPPRPLDYASLTAMADIFFPRIWLRRATMVPVGTVSMTVYFHADAEHLAQTGEGYLLGQARAQAFYKGFFDQTAQLWSEAGVLLCTTHQTVYYKQ
jgi:acyl-CoA thioesterase